MPWTHADAQRVLRFYYEHSSQFEEPDRKLPDALWTVAESIRGRLTRTPAVGAPAVGAPAGIASAQAEPFDYSTRCDAIVAPAIVQTSPAKFLSCQAELARSGADTLTPLWIVRKYGNARPYYSALILARRDAPVRGFDDDMWRAIERVYLADSTSTSGFVAPLHLFWTQGILDAPTVEAAKRKFGSHVVMPSVADPRTVKARLRRDSLAIGAVGEYQTAVRDDSSIAADDLRVVVRYDLIPQGVIAVTSDLVADSAAIDSVWRMAFRTRGDGNDAYYGLVDSSARVIARSSLGISGVVPFTGEYVNAYRALRQKIRQVRGEVPVGPIETRSGRWVTLRSGLVSATVLGIAFLGGILVAGAMQRRSELSLYVFLLALIAAWFILFFSPKVLSGPGFFLFIVLSAALGTTLRSVYRLLRTGVDDGAARPSAFVEAAAGLVLAFGFTLLFFGSELLVHREFSVPPAEVDIQRISIVVAVLSFGAALLIEDAYRILTDYFTRRLQASAEGGPPRK